MMPVSYILLAVTVISSVVGLLYPPWLQRGQFEPYKIVHRRQYERFFTHVFLHGSWVHLLLNGFILYSVGPETEKGIAGLTGHIPAITYTVFILFYLSAGVVSSLYGCIRKRNDPDDQSVGASGSIMAVLFAYVCFDPERSFRLPFLPFSIPIFLLALSFLVYSWISARFRNDRVDHETHIFGALYGLIFVFLIKPSLAVGVWNTCSNFFQAIL